MIAVRFMALFEQLSRFDPTERGVASGAHLFRRGDDVSDLHLVAAGEAHLVRHRTDGGHWCCNVLVRTRYSRRPPSLPSATTATAWPSRRRAAVNAEARDG